MPQAAKPAMISGPGAMSQRTDGGAASKQAQRYISGMPNYGDGQELSDLQASAPMSASNVSAPKLTPSQMAQAVSSQQGGQTQQQPVTPLTAPTQRPNEPVTAGSPLGAGPGLEALGINPAQTVPTGQSAKSLVQTLASHPDASPELRQLASVLGR